MSLSPHIFEATQLLAQLMIKYRLKLASAESCTGGMLSQWFTHLNGSSEWFECGFVTYSNESKIKLLDVKLNALDEYGAVSDLVAKQMALGALKNSHADIAISTTGIAGPAGGSEAKPVGTVYVATASKNQNHTSQYANAQIYHFKGNRQAIREQTVQAAINSLIDELRNLNG